MIFEKLLMPDEVYSSFEELTPEHMKELGKKYIFSDIDNTLATYDDMYPPENVKKWCARMAENGIKVAFVSNNNLERVEKFNSHFGYAAYSKAGKPKTGKLKLAMANTARRSKNPCSSEISFSPMQPVQNARVCTAS